MAAAAWHPDPFQRHELRWWDGTQWTEHVSDHGVNGTDPPMVAPAPVTVPHPTLPPPTVTPAMSLPQQPVAAPVKTSRTPLIAGAAIAAVALVVGAVVLTRGDGDKGASATTTVTPSTTIVATTTTVAATTTVASTSTTVPVSTVPTANDEDALYAAMPTETEAPADWSIYSQSEAAPDPASGPGYGFCGGDNEVKRALAQGSTAQVAGPTWDVPSKGWFGVNAYAFPTAAAAGAFLDATNTQANGCMNDAPTYTVSEGDVDLFDESVADSTLWNVAEGNLANEEQTGEADRLLRVVFDQYFSVTVDGTDYSTTFSELSRHEQHGRVVLVFWLFGSWNYQGWGDAPTWAYQPTDADLDAATAAVRATIVTRLQTAGLG